MTGICRHCHDRPSRRRNGLCDACNVYVRSYGRLPSAEVLVRRALRDIEGTALPAALGPEDVGRLRTLGLPWAKVRAILRAQGMACIFCGRPFPRSPRSPLPLIAAVRVSGRVRGLACPRCDYAVACLGGVPGLEKALRYLSDGSYTSVRDGTRLVRP